MAEAVIRRGVESALRQPMASFLADRQQITLLLRHWQAGEGAALDRLSARGSLRSSGALARLHMRGEAARGAPSSRPRSSTRSTSGWLELPGSWTGCDRAHFLPWPSRLMRRVLVDAARARDAGKRGTVVVIRVTFRRVLALVDPRRDARPDVLALDEALTRSRHWTSARRRWSS